MKGKDRKGTCTMVKVGFLVPRKVKTRPPVAGRSTCTECSCSAGTSSGIGCA